MITYVVHPSTQVSVSHPRTLSDSHHKSMVLERPRLACRAGATGATLGICIPEAHASNTAPQRFVNGTPSASKRYCTCKPCMPVMKENSPGAGLGCFSHRRWRDECFYRAQHEIIVLSVRYVRT
jgi:hypothetical protein